MEKSGFRKSFPVLGQWQSSLKKRLKNWKDYAGISRATEVLNIRKSSDKSNETEDAEIITTMMITGIL